MYSYHLSLFPSAIITYLYARKKPTASMSKTVIDANSNNFLPNLKELLRYKDLFFTLAWRDFKVRYAQTTIGLLWAFIQPLITLIILTVVFNKVGNVQTEVPHIVFTIAGLSIWTYFSFVMTNSGNSIIGNQEMVKKIYFPRLIIPLSKAIVGFIDFGITVLMLVVLMIYYQVAPSGNIWMAPFFIIAGIVAALGVGIWLSALSVRFRDIQHVVPFMVQLGLYASPVAYPAETLTDQLPRWAVNLYYLNPMAGITQGFRWSVFGGQAPDTFMWISFAMVLLLFISGLFYFKKVEKDMADFV